MTNEQKAYIEGMKRALKVLADTDRQYLIIVTDRLPQKIAKENALGALRGFRETLKAEISAKEKECESEAKAEASEAKAEAKTEAKTRKTKKTTA